MKISACPSEKGTNPDPISATHSKPNRSFLVWSSSLSLPCSHAHQDTVGWGPQNQSWAAGTHSPHRDSLSQGCQRSRSRAPRALFQCWATQCLKSHTHRTATRLQKKLGKKWNCPLMLQKNSFPQKGHGKKKLSCKHQQKLSVITRANRVTGSQ